MNTNFKKMQKRIMMRVYYIFGIRVVVHPLFTHAVVIGISGFILTRLVHVAAVYHNILNVKIGEFGSYVVHVITQSDLATLLALGLIIFACLSLRWQLREPLRAVRLL